MVSVSPAIYDTARQRQPLELSLVSDSRLLRDGIVQLLAEHLRVRVVGSYDGSTAPTASLPNPPGHVVLLDGRMRPELGTAWVRYWRMLDPPAQVIALELDEESDTILAYVEAGAGGFTMRGTAVADVIQAIEWAREGVAHVSPRLTADLFARLAGRTASHQPPPFGPALPPLTQRELEVLHYVNLDYSNQQIAELLTIEVRTVKHHVHNILQKLQLRHRWDAARLAVEQGWLEPAGASRTPSRIG